MDTGATPRRRVAWACTCQPSAMPIKASPKGGGRSHQLAREPRSGASRPTTISPLPTYGGVCRRRQTACRQTAFGCTYTSLSHVHSPIGTSLSRSAFKTTLRGASSKRYVAKPAIVARKLKPLQFDDTLEVSLKIALSFEHSVVPQ